MPMFLGQERTEAEIATLKAMRAKAFKAADAHAEDMRSKPAYRKAVLAIRKQEKFA